MMSDTDVNYNLSGWQGHTTIMQLYALANLQTCFLPCCLQLWDTERPDGNISLVHSSSMRQFNWGYTQFSQFNADDSLLLVSGVYLGPHHSSSGEIAVISLGRNLEKHF